MKIPPSWKLRQFAKYAAVLVGKFVERKPRTRVHRCALTSANNALKLDLTRPHYEAFGVNCEILIDEPDIFSFHPSKLIATRHSIAQTNFFLTLSMTFVMDQPRSNQGRGSPSSCWMTFSSSARARLQSSTTFSGRVENRQSIT